MTVNRPIEERAREWSDAELDQAITMLGERRTATDELIHVLGVERAKRREVGRAVDDAMTTARATIIDGDEC